MANKMTKKDYFNALLNVEEVKSNAGLVSFINHELELLAKKNSTVRKPTATQMENESLKKAILNGMEVGLLYTISDLIKYIPELSDLSNQRVSAIVRQMKESGEVTRTEDKRKAYFSKAI